VSDTAIISAWDSGCVKAGEHHRGRIMGHSLAVPVLVSPLSGVPIEMT
jgi:hypothetical protein